MPRCESVNMWKFENVKISTCENVKKWNLKKNVKLSNFLK